MGKSNPQSDEQVVATNFELSIMGLLLMLLSRLHYLPYNHTGGGVKRENIDVWFNPLY